MLAVWCESRRVGYLTVEQGRFCFVYADSWIKDETAFVLSPHFPFQSKSFNDHVENKKVEWFFENLLPEGGMREAMARKRNLHTRDIFGLLSNFGEELAGALSLLYEEDSFPQQQLYLPISTEDLRQMILESSDSSLMVANEKLHMSLAGVQNKIAVKYKNNKFFLPQGAAASSHILKPDNNNSDFEFCPANEYFCMRLARDLNIDVPDVELLHIPEPVYLIRRYDRVSKSGHIKRLHQIDLCQLLNKWEGYKYESHAGISLEDVFLAVKQLTQPAVDKHKILNWYIFNYLIGNSDAHAKNISFILSAKGMRMAPFYDLLCVHAYLPNSQMAMYVDDEARPGWFIAETWKKLAEMAGVPFRLVKSQLQTQIKGLSQKIHALSLSKYFTLEEKKFIESKVIPVIEQRIEFVNEAIISN